MSARLRLAGRTLGAQRQVLVTRAARDALELTGEVYEASLGGVPLHLSGSTVHVPALPGELVWTDESGEHRAIVEVDASARPNGAQADAVTGLMRRLLGEGPLTLARLQAEPLFFRDALWQKLEPHPIGVALDRCVGALHQIAQRPRSRLREEHVVQPVERVRRPARDADRWLVRDGRGLVGGFAPRATHLRARLLEDDLSIYENRVVVSLCRAAREWVRRRLEEVELALRQAQRIHGDLARLARLGLHERVGRWRKAAGVDEALAKGMGKGESRRDALRQQQRALAAVLDGPLGQALADVPQVHGAVESTNIFAFDERYVAVARAWRAWRRLSVVQPPPDPVLDDVDRAYRRYTRMATLKALALLRFDPDSASAPLPVDETAPRYALSRADGWHVWLEATPMGLDLAYRRIDPEQEEKDRLVGRHPPAPSRIHLHATFDVGLGRPESQPDTDQVWVHPETDLDDYSRPDYVERASLGPGSGSPALPLAPWHFGGVDALARLLRGRLLGADLQAGRLPESCPVCGVAGRVDARPEDRVCRDDNCGTRWGRRKCGCGAWIPKLLPDLKLSSTDFEVAGFAARQALLDLLIGRDGLSDLCHADTALKRMWMVCPACGDCGRDAKAGCPRCSAQ